MVASVIGKFFRNMMDGGFGPFDRTEFANMAKILFSAQSGITAFPGGGQTNATPLVGAVNQVENSGVGGTDSVVLPIALPGLVVQVNNSSGHAIQVFGAVSNPDNPNAAGNPQGDTIAASGSNVQQATATGVSHADATQLAYTCYKLGQWKQD